MNRRLPFAAVLGLFLAGTAIHAAKPPVARPSEAVTTASESRPTGSAPLGIAKRVPWTTSRVVGSPDPPDPYRTEVAFPKIRFESPLAMNVVPGTNRLAVAERYGKIYTFVNLRDVAYKTLLIDMKHPVYGIAFHPDYAKNGYVFVTHVLDGGKPSPRGTRVSRFTVKDPKTFEADPTTEKVLLEWLSGGHNGGCLRFGPDGYLYISAGDASGIADELKTGQDIRDIPGSILRIDVNRTEGKRNYAIPKDNPFVKTPGARPEIFSYGHRQLWKFSFTRDGLMWGGEIGQDLWEMIHILNKGGNYGWSVMEASHPFRPNRPKGPTPFVKPIIEHNHNDFRSITAGYVSYTDRLPELKGAHIYGDYDTGRIWTFRYKDGKVTKHFELVDTTLRVVAFGTDNAGEVYVVDFVGGQMHRLVKAPPPRSQAPAWEREPKFPRKLSETGLFASTKDHTPAPGLIPYTVNAPLYSDGAAKERFIALPGDSKIEFDAVVYPQPAPGAPPGWRFPDGTVLVKTFSLETEPGNPKSRRRLETRILHHKKMTGVDDEYGAQVWLGYTYVWNDEQTDAFLLDKKGLDKTFAVKDPRALGGVRKQKWHFPSRAECTLCHTMSAKYVLGVNTLQMNKDHDYGGGVKANQLEVLNSLNVFTRPLAKKPPELPALVDYRIQSKPLQKRARAYLHANCSHCHRKWGGGNAEFQLLASLNLPETGTIDVRPGQGTFKLKDPRILVPGDPNRSMLLHRMKLEKLGRMPHVASTVLDQEGIALISTWIRSLPANKAGFTSLFNGKNLAGWRGPARSTNGDWKTVSAVALDSDDNRKFAIKPGDGILLNGDKGRTVNLFTVPEHGDCDLRLEFNVPKGSNSGVYLQGRYEIQILDSYGVKKPKYGDCGGVYRRIVKGKPTGGKAPAVNASKPPGEWQSFRIVFRAPRFDKTGKKTQNARFVKVFHNGKLIHEDVEVAGPTVAAAFGDERPKGPIMLQGDHGPVAYRNLKIAPLKLD